MSDKVKLFGKQHNVIGESSSDLILKCRGAVKIQWGNKFIDLIKDGKINTDSKFIYEVDSVNDIKNKDGLYLTIDGSVYLKVKEVIIPIVDTNGTSYVSFMQEQETSPEQKYTALKNIGFLYDNIGEVDESSLQNGLVYIAGEQKLYLISNGQLEEFRMTIPSPFTQQFVIQKSNTLYGSLVIKGQGIENSLAFDSMYIYNDEEKSHINSTLPINITIEGSPTINITKTKTLINNITQSNTFQSSDASESSGFILSMQDGVATLIIDQVIERLPKDIYSNSGVFNSAQYTSTYSLNIDDNSTKFASTEWTHKLIPKGSIILFNSGAFTIPSGWAICDGTNNTPDLSGSFITDTSSDSTSAYSVVYIMKIV